MWLPAERLNLKSGERRQLTQLLRDPLTPKKLAMRISIVMGASRGKSNSQLAQELAVSRPTIIHWRKRFEEAGIAGLGRMPAQTALGNEVRGQRDVRQHTGKVLDIVGVYVGPRDKALVFTVDERPRRDAPRATRDTGDLPLKQIREYIRQGTRTLFAAVGLLLDRAGESPAQGSRDSGLTRFLENIEEITPEGLQVYLIVDFRGTHETPQLKAWLAEHPRFHVHCTPVENSWLKLVERWWSVEVNRELMRRRTLDSVADLLLAVDTHLRNDPSSVMPFAWKSKSFHFSAA